MATLSGKLLKNIFAILLSSVAISLSYGQGGAIKAGLSQQVAKNVAADTAKKMIRDSLAESAFSISNAATPTGYDSILVFGTNSATAKQIKINGATKNVTTTGIEYTISGTSGTVDSLRVRSSSFPTTGNYFVDSATGRTWIKGAGAWRRQSIDSTIAIVTSTLYNNLVGYYDLEETSGAVINSVGSPNGTVIGSPVRGSAGHLAGKAYTFDTGSYVNIGAISTSNVFTFGAWVYPTNTLYSPTLFQSGAATQTALLQIAQSGEVQFLKSDNTFFGQTTAIPLNTWTHIALTYDASGNWVLYTNGTSSASGTNLLSFTHGNYFFAGTGLSTTYPSGLPGKMDKVALYDRALSGSEIVSLMNSPYPF